MNLLEILCSSRYLCVLRAFFVFEGLWWKFFGALKAWIRKTSPSYSFLKFLEAFDLDSNDLWDLGRWFGWFLFECSSYSKLKFLKLPEASGLDSSRVSVLLNLLWCCLCSKCLGVCRNALGRLLFIGVWGGWMTHGKVWLVIHVTAWLDCLCHCLHAPDCLCHRLHVTMCDFFFFLHAFYAFIPKTLGKFLLVS